MSDESKEDGVQLEQDGVEQKDVVAYESFQRALDEKKRVRDENEQLKSELDKIRRGLKEKQGDQDNTLQSYKKQIEELMAENKNLKSTFAQTQIDTQIQQALSARGCKDPKKALRLMEDESYGAIFNDVDEKLNVGERTLSYELDKFQKDNPFIFGKPAPKIADGSPGRENAKTLTKELNLEKLSADEIREMIKKQS